jgi:hypothetical protein
MDKEKSIEIFGVPFKARLHETYDGDGMLILEPQTNWSLSRSASQAKYIAIFERTYGRKKND